MQKPFWEGLTIFLSMAQIDMRRAIIDAKVFWSAIGLQLSRWLTLSLLCLKIVVDPFQEGGILALIRHVFRMLVTMLWSGSSYFHVVYGRRSGPGAEFGFVLFIVSSTSWLVMGASSRSVGVTSCHNWNGGGPVGVLGSAAFCLA